MQNGSGLPPGSSDLPAEQQTSGGTAVEAPPSPSKSGVALQQSLAALADLALQLGPTVGGPGSAALTNAVAAVGLEVRPSACLHAPHPAHLAAQPIPAGVSAWAGAGPTGVRGRLAGG